MDDDLARALRALHDEYAAAVNTAVAEDREQLVDQLANEYSTAAIELILDRGQAA